MKMKFLLLALALLVGYATAFSQTVTIVPSGTPQKPNLIPVNSAVTFSINPVAFGRCAWSLSYSWVVLNAKNDTLFRSTSDEPNYKFNQEGLFTVTLTVSTGTCSNITKTASTTLWVGKTGKKNVVPEPNMFSANNLGSMISAYNVDANGQILSGPYDYLDPFPANNAITAALAMDEDGTFYYMPTFMNGNNPIPQQGKAEVWAISKKNPTPVVVASFDLNGDSTSELGLYRLGLDKDGVAWVLANDSKHAYAAAFKTDGMKKVSPWLTFTFNVEFESGSPADFESGDLAFDNKGNMYVLAGSSTGTFIYTMSRSFDPRVTPKLTKKWVVKDAGNRNFPLPVTGTVFDQKGNMFFSAIDGMYYINSDAVDAATATAVLRKISENFGLMDLATSQFPTAWSEPFEGALLPIKLMQFTGALAGEKALLNWQVADNETGNYFELQKSTNGVNYSLVAMLFVSEKTGVENYRYTDAANAALKTYYRLKIVNKDQSVSYSNVVYFDARQKAATILSLLQNPVQNTLSFNYQATQNTLAEVSVYTSSGVKIMSQKHNVQKGNNSLSLPLAASIQKGLYLLQVSDNNNSQTIRFVKQ